ncbi:MAG: hypothetical protein ABIA04_12165 [Pseudomonadota bacterium]
MGPTTGILLYTLCPEQGERNTELMWRVIALSAFISPLVMLLFNKVLDVETRRKRANAFKEVYQKNEFNLQQQAAASSQQVAIIFTMFPCSPALLFSY